MVKVLRGNIISAPNLGELQCCERGSIVYEDGAILGVFQNLPERFLSAQAEDFGSCLILQGFADMHLHGPQYPMVGTGMDLPLLKWLEKYAFPTEARFSDLGYAREIFLQLADELKRNGTTRVCMFSSIHTDATIALMDILEQAGICGYVGKVNMDRNGASYYEESTEESKSETIRWLKLSEKFSRIRPILTPRFTPSCSDTLMQWLGDLSKERNLPVQSHLSENRGEIDFVHSLHPDTERYWESYSKFGLFHQHVLMAHCVYSDAIERKALKDYGVTVVHCPDSNINIISGISPVRKMLDEGVHLTLGSDIAGGSQLSMLSAMRMAIRSSKVRAMDPERDEKPITAAEAYYLGTSAGAAFFGEKPGFAKGNPLHSIVIDDTFLPDTDRLSLTDRLERAIYRTDSRNVAAVYSGGKRIL